MHSLPEIREGDPCVPGVLYKLECNTCRCTDARTLLCTKMACIDWKNYNKMNSGKKALRNEGEKKVKNLKTYNYLPSVQKGVLCKPGKLYRSKCTRCYCTDENAIVCSKKQKQACIFDKNGKAPPIRTPEDVMPPLLPADLIGIPTLTSASEMCNPGRTYKVDCHYCICLDNNNLLCEKKLCISYDDMNRMEAKEMSGKPCDVGETTTVNCKRCDCTDGKTNCYLIANCSSDRLQLAGSAGPLPHEHLNPETDKGKCVPKSIYKVDCNKCYCQADGSLRCTQKTCLNYSQVKLLEKQREYLEQHGL